MDIGVLEVEDKAPSKTITPAMPWNKLMTDKTPSKTITQTTPQNELMTDEAPSKTITPTTGEASFDLGALEVEEEHKPVAHATKTGRLVPAEGATSRSTPERRSP